MIVHLQNNNKAEFKAVRKKVEAQEKEEATASSGMPAVLLQPVQHTIEHPFEFTSPMPKVLLNGKP